MKHKILTFFLACLVPWLAGAQQSANSQNNVAEKDYIAYLFTYFTGNHISEEAVWLSELDLQQVLVALSLF